MASVSGFEVWPHHVLALWPWSASQVPCVSWGDDTYPQGRWEECLRRSVKLRRVFVREWALSEVWYDQLWFSVFWGNVSDEFCIRRVTYTGLHRKKIIFSSGKKTWKMLIAWRLPCGHPAACWEPLCVPSPAACLPAPSASNQGWVNRTAVQRWHLCQIPLQI